MNLLIKVYIDSLYLFELFDKDRDIQNHLAKKNSILIFINIRIIRLIHRYSLCPLKGVNNTKSVFSNEHFFPSAHNYANWQTYENPRILQMVSPEARLK